MGDQPKKFQPIPNVVGLTVAPRTMHSALYPYRAYAEVSREIAAIKAQTMPTIPADALFTDRSGEAAERWRSGCQA